MDNCVYLSEEGLSKIKLELIDLKKNKRKEIADELSLALEYGDISENFAFDEAQNKKAFLEGRIRELENLVKKAKVVDSKITKKSSQIGCSITVKDGKGKREKYHLVTMDQTDPLDGKISIDSPIGSALYEKNLGDRIVINTPNGSLEYEIIEIS